MSNMTVEEIKNLVVLLQTTEDKQHREWALSDLVHEAMEYMDSTCHPLAKKGRSIGMSLDEIKQEYIIQVATALTYHADARKGNPLLFSVWKAKHLILDLIRKEMRKKVRQYCHSCDNDTYLNKINGSNVCPRCGESNPSKVDLVSLYVVDGANGEDADNNYSQMDKISLQKHLDYSLEDGVTDSDLINRFRSRLSGRRLEIFDMIILDGYDRDSCTNYQKEIALKFGVSQTNINTRIRQIKQAWLEFKEEELAGDICPQELV
ncbi:sigma-70 family RNA polymerase sigma factor [Bacillus phage vB_BpsS-140]|nr:sigma-70 family RNA polymerase sigma factor [Bacillus phage vB_BpsS-140]